MNYELKSINPVSVLINALRVFIILDFFIAILVFFVLPSSTLRVDGVWQKLVATAAFTVSYTLAVSVTFALVAWIYNFWAASFKGIKVHFEQENG